MAMIVNTSWLLDYLDPKCAHEEILRAFPQAGLEIEQQHELKNELQSVRIGFVRDKQRLKDDPEFFVCKIEIERNKIIPVLCASEHEVEVGWGVPVACAGTTLPTARAPLAAKQMH